MSRVETSATRTPAWIGYTMVLIASTLFGLNGGFSRVVLQSETDTSTFTSLRITGSMLVLALVAALADRDALRFPPLRRVPLLLGLGIIGLVGSQWANNIAITRLPLGIAMLLIYLGPVLVVLWVRFVRHEPVSRRVWPGLGLTVAGLAVVGQVWRDFSLDTTGVILSLVAAACFAIYLLIGEHPDVTTATPLHITVWSFIVAAATMTMVRPAWTAEHLADDASGLGRFAALTVPTWLAMGLVVVLGTVAPFFLILVALRILPATVVSVTAMFEPVMAVVVGWFWFDERLSAGQIAGVVAVLTGIVLAQTARRAEPEPLPPPP